MNTSPAAQLPTVPTYAAKWDPHDVWDNMNLTDGGLGLMTQYGGYEDRNSEAFDFMSRQYRRFGLRTPGEDMLRYCWGSAFYAIDQVDPYILFYGCTDVVKTEENYYYQFSVSDDGVRFEDASPDDIEVFRYWDGGVNAWETILRHPGLEFFFDAIHDYFSDHFDYVKEDKHQEYWPEEIALLNRYGPQAQDLIHLGIWAAIMWMTSPEPHAREWRYNHHPVFQICYDEKACVLNGWRFHSPEFFRKSDRPVKSCATCKTEEWCVELVQASVDSDILYICEYCHSKGEPFPDRVCGTKMCENSKCKHHPMFGKGKELTRAIAADKRFGPLRQLESGHKVRDLPGLMYINNVMINKYSNRIADDMGRTLSGLLGFNNKG